MGIEGGTAETAVRLADRVLPRLPLRQWVLTVPKRLRYFLHRDTDLQSAALRLFLRVIEDALRAHSPGANGSAPLGALAFIHRSGSSLNPHLHLHCVIIDGVFASNADGGVAFSEAGGLDEHAFATVQASVRQRPLALFVRRRLLPVHDAHTLRQWQHRGGFSVHASVRIAATDSAGRERLLAIVPDHLRLGTAATTR